MITSWYYGTMAKCLLGLRIVMRRLHLGTWRHRSHDGFRKMSELKYRCESLKVADGGSQAGHRGADFNSRQKPSGFAGFEEGRAESSSRPPTRLEPPKSATAEIHEAQSLVVINVPARTRWAEFHVFLRGLIEAQPILTNWNWIIDDRGPMDDVDVAEMARTGEVFRALASKRSGYAITIVVTSDPHFAPWAKVMDLNYGNRRHYAATTRAAAEALLGSLTGQGGLETGSA